VVIWCKGKSDWAWIYGHENMGMNTKNYAGSVNHSPYWLRKRKPLWYHRIPLPADKKGPVR
jgi:hypothetical protein